MTATDPQPTAPTVWAYVISWTGHAEDARRIAAGLVGAADRVVVVYSNSAGTTEDGPGEWVQVSDALFYGGKLAASLDGFDADVMLQVQADARADWPALVDACRRAFATVPDLDLWSPVVDYSGITLEETLIETVDGRHHVAAVDSIVWGLSRRMCRWLATLDIGQNTYGWGVEVAAAVHARTTGHLVVLDPGAKVDHPRSTAYDTSAAEQHYTTFLDRVLTDEERRLLDADLARADAYYDPPAVAATTPWRRLARRVLPEPARRRLRAVLGRG